MKKYLVLCHYYDDNHHLVNYSVKIVEIEDILFNDFKKSLSNLCLVYNCTFNVYSLIDSNLESILFFNLSGKIYHI